MMVINAAKEGKRTLSFHGNGEFHKLAKKHGINSFSIDDGRDFKNYDKLKRDMQVDPNVQIISLRKLALQGYGIKEKFDTIWPDFTGHLTDDFLKDTVPYLPNIMAETGYLFVTLFHTREHYGKGLSRIERDRLSRSMIRQAFAKEDIKLSKYIIYPYKSLPIYEERKTDRKTPMIMYGFKWKTIRHY